MKSSGRTSSRRLDVVHKLRQQDDRTNVSLALVEVPPSPTTESLMRGTAVPALITADIIPGNTEETVLEGEADAGGRLNELDSNRQKTGSNAHGQNGGRYLSAAGPPSLSNGMSARLLSRAQLRELGISYSREHLWRLESAGKFPRRLYLSPQRVVWLADEIAEWLDQRVAERAKRVYRDHD